MQAARQHGVVVTSDVPDVRPYLSRASVCVVPLRIARGIQNKILEAMATGTPVVTTPEAFRGIEAEPGRDLFVESLPSEFASRVLALMADRALRMTVSDSARRAVERRYRWESCLGPLDDLLAAAVADRSVACRDTLSGSRAGGT